jgi:hypothetical protein
MSGRSSASRDAGVRDWVNSTLCGDDLRPPSDLSRQRAPKQSFHDSSRELQAGLDVQELGGDTIPAEFLDHFGK